MIAIDKLCYTSRLRYVNAGEKFAFTVMTLLLCVISRSTVTACIVLAATGILTVKKGGIPFFRYIRYLMLPLAFLILSTLAILLSFSKTPLDLFAIPLGDWYLTASRDTYFYTLQLILTALASVSCLYFLAFSTPMPDFLEVLRRLHCPGILIELMMLIYRFIFLLMNTASAITLSQNSRLGNKDYRTSLKSFSSMASVLLIRSFGRAGALYDAMESRCYDGSIRVLTEMHPPKPRHIVALILFELFLLTLTVWVRLF